MTGERPHLDQPPPDTAAAMIAALPAAVLAFDAGERLVYANPAASGLFSPIYDRIVAGDSAPLLAAAIAGWLGGAFSTDAILHALRTAPKELHGTVDDGRAIRLRTALAGALSLMVWTDGGDAAVAPDPLSPSLRLVLAARTGHDGLETLATVLRAVLEGIAEAVAAVDLNANLIACNARYVTLLGIDPAKLVAGQSLDFALEAAWPRFRDFRQFTALGTAIARDPASPVSGRIDWHDGRVFAVTVHPLVIGGTPLGRVWGWFDVTARERALDAAEAALIEARAGEAAKSAFLATMSHEIRTPLNGIVGMLDLLHGAPLGDEHRMFLNIARECSDTLLTLVSDILDYSKFDSGLASLESLPFDPRAEAETVTAALGPQAAAKGLDLALKGIPPGQVMLLGDPTRVRQILFNLAGNAIKFTEEGRIDIAIATTPCPDGRTALEISVRDTGIGIAPAMQNKLFQRFSQGDTSITRRYGGTGLGLAIVRQLTTLMDGDIALTSEPGHGSEFRVTLRLPHSA